MESASRPKCKSSARRLPHEDRGSERPSSRRAHGRPRIGTRSLAAFRDGGGPRVSRSRLPRERGRCERSGFRTAGWHRPVRQHDPRHFRRGRTNPSDPRPARCRLHRGRRGREPHCVRQAGQQRTFRPVRRADASFGSHHYWCKTHPASAHRGQGAARRLERRRALGAGGRTA